MSPLLAWTARARCAPWQFFRGGGGGLLSVLAHMSPASYIYSICNSIHNLKHPAPWFFSRGLSAADRRCFSVRAAARSRGLEAGAETARTLYPSYRLSTSAGPASVHTVPSICYTELGTAGATISAVARKRADPLKQSGGESASPSSTRPRTFVRADSRSSSESCTVCA